MDNQFKNHEKETGLLFNGRPVVRINGLPVLTVNGVPTPETVEATADGQAFVNSPTAKEYAALYEQMTDGSDDP